MALVVPTPAAVYIGVVITFRPIRANPPTSDTGLQTTVPSRSRNLLSGSSHNPFPRFVAYTIISSTFLQPRHLDLSRGLRFRSNFSTAYPDWFLLLFFLDLFASCEEKVDATDARDTMETKHCQTYITIIEGLVGGRWDQGVERSAVNRHARMIESNRIPDAPRRERIARRWSDAGGGRHCHSTLLSNRCILDCEDIWAAYEKVKARAREKKGHEVWADH